MAERKFIDAMLKAHNDYRRIHGVPALKINKDLNKMAQNWADQLARTNRFEHSKNRSYQSSPVGENLAMKWTSNNEEYKGDEATKQWYDELSQYNFNTASGPGTGHFTQVVWRDSRELGVGKAQTRDGKWIAVANYFPAGNYIGRYHENVPPPGAKPTKQAPPPKAASTTKYAAPKTTVTTTHTSTPKSSSGPKGWFSRSSSSSTTKEVPIVEAREFNPNTRIIHSQGASRPTFTTTVVTERNTQPTVNRSHMFQTPASSTQASRGYSKTVVTETVIGPDGKKTVTTREVVQNNVSGPSFGRTQGSYWQ